MKIRFLIVSLTLILPAGACLQSEPPPECKAYRTLSAVERLVVSNSEKVLLATGKANDFSIKCILVGEANGSRFAIFAAPVGKTATDMPTDAYAAQTTVDGRTVEYINLAHPFGEWQKVKTVPAN